MDIALGNMQMDVVQLLQNANSQVNINMQNTVEVEIFVV